MRKNAYKLGREMVWSNVAKMYLKSFDQARQGGTGRTRKAFATKTLDEQPRELPEFKLDHLARMTDSTGLFQHALFTAPNFAEGYCTDDVARAFILTVMLDELEEEPALVRELATTYLAFMHYAFSDKANRFHNHLSFDRHWVDEVGSEDCHGRGRCGRWVWEWGVRLIAVFKSPPDSCSRGRCRWWRILPRRGPGRLRCSAFTTTLTGWAETGW